MCRIRVQPVRCLFSQVLLATQILPISPTFAANNYWVGGLSDSWNINNNWTFTGVIRPLPRVPTDGDVAILQSPINDAVRLYGNTAPIDGLQIRNGISLNTNGYLLQVEDEGLAQTTVSGSGSHLVVRPRNSGGLAVQLEQLSIEAGGEVSVSGGMVIDGELMISGQDSLLRRGIEEASIRFGGDIDVQRGRIEFEYKGTPVNYLSFDPSVEVTVSDLGGIDLRLPSPLNIHSDQHWQIEEGSFLRLASPNITIDGGSTVTVEGPSSSFLLDRYEVNSQLRDSILTIGHATAGTGTLRVTNSARFEMGTGSATLLSGGTLEIVDGVFESVRGLDVNGGTYWMRSGTYDMSSGTNPFRVRGGGNAIFEIPLLIDDSDTYLLENGRFTADTISFGTSGEFDFQGGKLSVRRYEASLVNEGGTLAPGQEVLGDATGDTTIVGNYTQQGDGTIQFEIGGLGMGAEYDFVHVTGNALIDGILEVKLVDGFTPASGDSFLVFFASGLSGFFDNAGNGGRIETADGSGSFRVNYGIGSANPNQILLSDFQATSADLDGDGDVDGNDFLLTQVTKPNLISIWQSQYGGDGTPASAFSVPESKLLPVFFLTIFLLRQASGLSC